MTLGTLRPFFESVTEWSKGIVHRLGIRGWGAGDWTDSLRGIGEEITALNTSTEAEFLTLGETLHKLYRQVREVSRLATSVADLMGGNAVADAAESFRRISEEIGQLQSESVWSDEALSHVLETAGEIRAQLSAFRRIVEVLRVLCITTRIESARLGRMDTGFDTLAGDVKKLSMDIESKCARLHEQTESVCRQIEQTLARVRDLATIQTRQIGSILDKTLSGLVTLTQKQDASAATANRIMERYTTISTSMGEIVASMQFHDITRQRFEHAGEALERLLSPGDSEGLPPCDRPSPDDIPMRPGGSPEATGDARHFAGDVCRLEAAQLRHAKDQFTTAVRRIMENLCAMAGNLDEISRDTETVAGSTGEAGQAFLSEMESGTLAMRSSLQELIRTSREIASAMRSLGSTLGEMSHFSRDIEEIGRKVKLIALNAIVKAAHLGEDGAALGVLAAAIHKLSLEAQQRTDVVGETLRSIMASADELSAGTQSEDRGEQVDRMEETLAALMEGLRRVNEETVATLGQVKAGGLALRHAIYETVEGIWVHERVEGVVSGLAARLEGWVAALGLAASPGEGALDDERLKALEASYTMEGEREVHLSILSMEEPPAALPTAVFAEPAGDGPMPEGGGGVSEDQTEEDLGDNVELF